MCSAKQRIPERTLAAVEAATPTGGKGMRLGEIAARTNDFAKSYVGESYR